MDKFLILFVLFVFFSFSEVFGDEVKGEGGKGYKNVLIVSLLTRDGDRYVYKGDSYSRGVIKSVYVYFRDLEGYKVDLMENPNFDINLGISNAILSNEGYDIYVYIEYQVKGDGLRYWVRMYDKEYNVLMEEVLVGVDDEIFDLVDNIALVVLRKLKGRNVGFAKLVIKEVKTGDKVYILEVGSDKYEIRDGVSFSVKLLSDNEYNLVVRDERGKEVYKEVVKLGLNEVREFSYYARSYLKVEEVGYKDRLGYYVVNVDGKLVREGEGMELSGNEKHEVVVVKLLGGVSNEVYRESLYLGNLRTNYVYPYDRGWGKMFNFELVLGNIGMVGMGCEMFLSRYVGLELVGGISFADFRESDLITRIGLGVKYYFVGDMGYDFRISGNVGMYGSVMYVGGGFYLSKVVGGYGGVGIEWKFVEFILGVGLGYKVNVGNIYVGPYLSVGIRL